LRSGCPWGAERVKREPLFLKRKEKEGRKGGEKENRFSSTVAASGISKKLGNRGMINVTRRKVSLVKLAELVNCTA
jgi:hypothetical protein